MARPISTLEDGGGTDGRKADTPLTITGMLKSGIGTAFQIKLASVAYASRHGITS